MSNLEYEDDDDDFTQVESSNNNDLVKQLRKQLKQKEKELSEFNSKLGELSKAQRERAVKDVLESRGVNSKIAKFIPSDLDPTEESLSKWLNENSDVFGFESTESNQPVVDPVQAAAHKKMNNAMNQGLTPDSSDDVLNKLLSANSKEELDDIIRQSGL